jgi:hypothetical protein
MMPLTPVLTERARAESAVPQPFAESRDAGLSSHPAPVAVLEWCFGGAFGGAPVHSSVILATSRDDEAALRGLAAAVLSKPRPDAFVTLSRVIDGELRVVLDFDGKHARHALFHDALAALRLLEQAEASSTRLSDFLIDLPYSFPKLVTWMDPRALLDGPHRSDLLQAVAMCMDWLAQFDAEDDGWESRRVAAHARILQHSDGQTAIVERAHFRRAQPLLQDHLAW